MENKRVCNNITACHFEAEINEFIISSYSLMPKVGLNVKKDNMNKRLCLFILTVSLFHVSYLLGIVKPQLTP